MTSPLYVIFELKISVKKKCEKVLKIRNNFLNLCLLLTKYLLFLFIGDGRLQVSFFGCGRRYEMFVFKTFWTIHSRPIDLESIHRWTSFRTGFASHVEVLPEWLQLQ